MLSALLQNIHSSFLLWIPQFWPKTSNVQSNYVGQMGLTLLLEATAKLRQRKMTVIRSIRYPGLLCISQIFRFNMCSIILKAVNVTGCSAHPFFWHPEKTTLWFLINFIRNCIWTILCYAFFILKVLVEFSLFVQVISYSSRLSIESRHFSIPQQIRQAGAVRLTIYFLFLPIFQL